MKKIIILVALLLTACNDMDSMRMPSEQSSNVGQSQLNNITTTTHQQF